MQTHSSRTLTMSLIGAVLVLAAIGPVWALAPDAAGPLLLASCAAATIVYLAAYALQRRRHW